MAFNSSPSFSLFIFAFLLLDVVFSDAFISPRKCRSVIPIEQRCFNAPLVSDVQLTSYIGRWHQLYTSGSATQVSSDECVTANYTLQSLDPVRIGVLNCGYKLYSNQPRPSCVRAIASKRPLATKNSQLQVQFFPFLPPGNYSIAALLGLPNYGYYAAAIYSCSQRQDGSYRDGFFFIARSPFAPKFTFLRLARELKCSGFPINAHDFVMTKNFRQCKYFDGPSGFDVRPPVRRRD